MYVMPVFTPNMFASPNAMYIARSSSLPLFRDEPSRLGFVKVFEKALSAAFPDNPVKRAGFLDDFLNQYEILIEFDPGSEAWSALTPRQQHRRKYFESVI